jgi:LuxR family transcriptional regulator, maltose regulon positive regulatory protein
METAERRRGSSGAPGLSLRHVPRPRLAAVLEGSSGAAIVLAAPAGYGKTTLAAEWAAGHRTSWFDASFAGGDIATFTGSFVSAAQRVLPDLGERLPRSFGNLSAESAARRVADAVANDLEAWPDDAWLVLDDYQLSAGSQAVDALVDRLLSVSPIRLLVTTRRRPAWATARRVLYGDVTLVGRDELAMTEDEVREVVRGASPAAVAELVERAQGWPALVGLAALTRSGRRPDAHITDELFRYFAEEVLRAEPPEIRRFMLRASVPVRLEATRSRDEEAAVTHLVAEGLLHRRPDDSLAFHPLLREFLVRKLREDHPEEWKRARVQAVDDARVKRPEEAFELAVDADDLESAAEVLAGVVDDLLEGGRLETLERWLGVCGPAATSRPRLQLARAEVMIRRGKLVEASTLAHRLAQTLPESAAEASSAWYLAGRAFHLLSEDEAALQCHLRASRCAASTRDRTNALWGASVVAAQLGSPVIDDVVAQMEEVAAADLDARLQLVSAKVFLGTRRGSLGGIWQSVERLADVEHTSVDGMARHTFLLAAGYLNTARADYARARALTERALELGDELELGRLKAAFAHCQAAAAAIGLRRFTEAERDLEAMSGLGVERTQVLLAEQSILRAKLLLAQGRASEVLAFPAELGSAAPATAAGEYQGLIALAAAAAGDAEASQLHAGAAAGGTTIESIFYARAARTLCSGEAARAKELFEAATEADFLDVLVLTYRAQPAFLEVLASVAPHAALKELLAASCDATLARRVGLAPPRPRRTNGHSELTPREREVLDLLAQGLSNADVARILFIAEKTTKVHVSHIFEKLGVQSRVQAVLAWRELQQ